jgi:hypothetical protein
VFQLNIPDKLGGIFANLYVKCGKIGIQDFDKGGVLSHQKMRWNQQAKHKQAFCQVVLMP